MISPLKILLIIFLLSFLHKIYCSTNFEEILYSIELNYKSTGIEYPEEWKQTNNYKRLYNCKINNQDNILVGLFGANELITRSYKNLPPHTAITLKFKLFVIDSWDSEFFYVHANNVQVYSYKHFVKNNEGTFTCGKYSPTWKLINTDKIVLVEFSFPHSDSFLDLKFSSNLDQFVDDESWGIKDFSLILKACKNECPSCSLVKDLSSIECNNCLTSTIALSYNNNLKCSKCHSSCKTCKGENQDDCLTCFDNAVLNTITGTCSCMTNYYLSNSYPFTCSSGTITINNLCAEQMNNFFNGAKVIHFCDQNVVTQTTNMVIQISPPLNTLNQSCFSLSLVVLNNQKENLFTTITDSIMSNTNVLTEIKLVITREELKLYGCKNELTESYDSYYCTFLINFFNKNLLQEYIEIYLMIRTDRQLKQIVNAITISPKKVLSNCLRDSCNITQTPSSTLSFCLNADCSEIRKSNSFVRSDTAYLLHKLDQEPLYPYYDLDKISIVLINSQGEKIDIGKDATYQKGNGKIIYQFKFIMADNFGSTIQVTSILTPKTSKRLLGSNSERLLQGIEADYDKQAIFAQIENIVIFEREEHDSTNYTAIIIALGCVIGSLIIVGVSYALFKIWRRKKLTSHTRVNSGQTNAV